MCESQKYSGRGWCYGLSNSSSAWNAGVPWRCWLSHWPSSLLTHWKGGGGWLKHLGHFTLMGDPGEALGFGWAQLRLCDPLGRKSVEKKSLSFLISVKCLSSKINKSLKNEMNEMKSMKWSNPHIAKRKPHTVNFKKQDISTHRVLLLLHSKDKGIEKCTNTTGTVNPCWLYPVCQELELGLKYGLSDTFISNSGYSHIAEEKSDVQWH